MNKDVQALIDQFVRMRVGQSFFVPDIEADDVEFLRRPAKRAGCGIRIVHVEQDEIYVQPGVRIWREEGEYDQL